ncbi:MAG: dephospho-CoA kinase [Verrucomicrobiota bacterium]|jgi:dephospho-CoA kinase
MKVCGLTGGVGMGKSTAARFLRERGALIVDTDEIARRLVQPGRPALAEIQNVFGQNVISPEGQLRRDKLAKIVFADPAARQKLEAILHPRIREQWLAQIEAWRGEDHPLAVVVIPLLFETRAESRFDKIVCVACSAVAQRERLLARGWTPEQIEQRIAAQMPVEQKIARADFVIWTDGALEIHARQIERLPACFNPKTEDGRERTQRTQRKPG